MIEKVYLRHKPLVALLLTVILLSVFIFAVRLNVGAQTIDETNPELEFTMINSDIMTEYGDDLYTSEGQYDHNASTGEYNLKTNAYVAWYTRDDLAYAYKEYNVSNKAGDYIDAQITVTKTTSVEGTGLDGNASAGLMFRAGLEPSAAEIFLHFRSGRLQVVYRSKDGQETLTKYSTLESKYPCEIRMVKKGNTVICSYKDKGETGWTEMTTKFGFQAEGPLYVGIAAHSCEQTTHIDAGFKSLKVTGIGTYDSNDSDSENSSSAPSQEEYVAPDEEVTQDILFRETFTDGDMISGEESVTNPIWTLENAPVITNIAGNRVWKLDYEYANNYIGNQNWTDYTASMDLKFTENVDASGGSANIIRFFVRHTDIPMYGNSDYMVKLTGGTKLELYYRRSLGNNITLDGVLQGSASIDNCLTDGKWHNLKVSAFDNVIRVYWDDNEVIKFVHTLPNGGAKLIFPSGGIGVGTYETSVYLDNITVTKLEDPLGGDYDNAIGGNWDEPIDSYVSDWTGKYIDPYKKKY